MVAMTRQKSRSARRLARWRFWVQAAVLLVWMNPMMPRLHTFCGPVFHCYSCPLATFACPIGVLANFSALHVIPFVAIGLLALFGGLVGSLICGWVCPFGFLQDLLGKVPLPKLRLPGWMGYGRYLVLVGLVLAIPYFFGEESPLFFCRLCPAGALEAAVPYTVSQAIAGKEVVWPSIVKLVILGLFLASALVIWRPWCRLFCPLGAIYTLCNRFSVFQLRFRANRCTDCRLCESYCRFGAYADKQPAPSRCVRCLDCLPCPGISVGTVAAKPEEPAKEP
jgi:polyferredoxin